MGPGIETRVVTSYAVGFKKAGISSLGGYKRQRQSSDLRRESPAARKGSSTPVSDSNELVPRSLFGRDPIKLRDRLLVRYLDASVNLHRIRPSVLPYRMNNLAPVLSYGLNPKSPLPRFRARETGRRPETNPEHKKPGPPATDSITEVPHRLVFFTSSAPSKTKALSFFYSIRYEVHAGHRADPSRSSYPSTLVFF